MDDSTTVIQGVGPVMKEKLDGVKINTVKDFIDVDAETLANTVGKTEFTLKTIQDRSKKVLKLTKAPAPEDHRKHENPYLSRFAKTVGKKRSKINCRQKVLLHH